MLLPGVSFVYPEMVWLLPALGLFWALALAVPRRLSPTRFYGSLALRTVIGLALVLALAGTQLHLPVDRVTTVFLLDASDSITPSARAQAETVIQEALAAMRPDDRAAIVVFGENALVERAPEVSDRLGRIASRPVAARTDIAEAIQLGLALLPADAQQRLVLLSDGGENTGSAIEAARLAAARGVPIDIVDLNGTGLGAETLLSRIEAPTRARDGQDLTVAAIVSSSVAQAATVRLLGDDVLLAERTEQLEPGENRVSFTVRAAGSGFQHYRVQIDALTDSQAANNEASALVQIDGPPRVLLVAEDEAEAYALLRALDATNIIAERVAPADMPADLAGLSAYEAVLLVNVPARSLPVGAIGALPAYVRDLGRGLVMIGGAESFGVGGYGRTPVEEALPVYMDVRDREERPELALVFVLDKSGSMDSCHCTSPDRRAPITGSEGYVRKVDIAKEAVSQAAALLGEQDTVGIVTFDRLAYPALPATRGASLDQVTGSLADMQPRGSTNVRTGLLAAEEMLQGVEARIKHVILLTDGWGSGGDNLDLAERMREQGITLTVVAAGGGSAGHLDDLALAGGGRFYPVTQIADVPQIFVQETISTVGNYIVERMVQPVAVAGSPLLAGIDAVPPIYGFNGSTIKETARPILLTDDAQPLLASWQFGLGRSVAWLSDAKGQWARDWMGWAGFPRFAAQITGWVLPTQRSLQTTAEVEVAGSEATLRLTTDAQAPPLDGSLSVTAALIGADGSRTEVTLAQVAPSTYQARLSSPDPGTYLVQIAGAAEERVVFQEMAGMVVPYSAEYGPDQGDPTLLAQLALVSGGGPLADGAAAFAPLPTPAYQAEEIGLPLLILALALLPLDIAVRRIAVRVRG